MNKKKAYAFYKAWMKEGSYCKILGKDVQVTRKGWDHIVRGSGSKFRKSSDISQRLSFLKDAKAIIKYADTVDITSRNGMKYITLRVRNKKLSMRKNIKVVLRQDKKGNTIFYSVMKTRK